VQIFSLLDDRYLVERCLLPPHALLDTAFQSDFLAHKRTLYSLAPPPRPPLDGSPLCRDFEGPPPHKHTHALSPSPSTDGDAPFFVTQLESSLPALQHRLRALASDPALQGRTRLLKLDCECTRMDAAHGEARRAAEARRKRKEEAAAAAADSRRKKRRSLSPSKGKGKDGDASPASSPVRSGHAGSVPSSVAASAADAEEEEALLAQLSEHSEQRFAAALALEETEADAASAAAATAASTAASSASSPRPLPALKSDWLERSLNIVLVRSGFREQVDAALLKRRGGAGAKGPAATRPGAPGASPPIPGAEFLPPQLSFLAVQPLSFCAAQVLLRDAARQSVLLRSMLRAAGASTSSGSSNRNSHINIGPGVHRVLLDGCHPHTGQIMLSVILCEDDPRPSALATGPAISSIDGAPPTTSTAVPSSSSSAPPAISPFLLQVLQSHRPEVLGAFVAYAGSPSVWKAEQVARQRLRGMSSVQKAHARLLTELEASVVASSTPFVRCNRCTVCAW
jgi:hypothetical protein